jgi:hypothetical protein
MSDMDFETQIRSIAARMEYPPTPDIAASVAARMRSTRPRLNRRIFARSLVLALVLLASLMLIPPVRAAVLDFIQIGIVRIFRTEPAPVPTQLPSTIVPMTASPGKTQSALSPLTATPVTTSTTPISVLEQMAGETTLTSAQKKAKYPILLPSYPADLGEPDRVFTLNADGPMTILVWMDDQHPGQVKLSLHFIPEGSWAVDKFAPRAIEETSVNGGPAVWAVGPYPMLLRNGDMQISRLINGHVLIWEDGGVTYRLETDTSMQEAVKIAESLAPVP